MEKDIYYESIEFALLVKKRSTYEIEKLNHPFVSKLPKHLYKYRQSGEKGRKEFYLGKRSIYTASFHKLHENDVFEGVTPTTKERIEKLDGESICRHYKGHIISLLKEKVPSLDSDKTNTIFDIILDEHFDSDRIFKRVCFLAKDEERKCLKISLLLIR